MKYIKRFNVEEEVISEHLQYHINNDMSITENIFRYGSESYFNLLKESRKLYDKGLVELSGHDKELFETSDIGKFEMFEGELVPLDLPLEIMYELNEAEYKGREVELNHPTRSSGPKKYKVFVKNPKTGNVKVVNFGDVSGGLSAKVSDPKARKSFASRHQCHLKKDKTTPGFGRVVQIGTDIFGADAPIQVFGNLKEGKIFNI